MRRKEMTPQKTRLWTPSTSTTGPDPTHGGNAPPAVRDSERLWTQAEAAEYCA